MSLSWPNQVRLLLSADGVRLQSTRWQQAPRTTHIPPAVSATATIAQAVNQLPPRRAEACHLLLADQHVHYLQLPAVQLQMSVREHAEFARAMVVQTWGEIARDWPIRLQALPAWQARLLVTTPLDWQAQPELAWQQRRWSIQPYASYLLQQTRLPADGSLLVPEGQGVRLFHFQRGQCVHVASRLSAQAIDIEQLAGWVIRERMLISVQQQPCYWLCEPGRQDAQRLFRQLQQQLAVALLLSDKALFQWPSA